MSLFGDYVRSSNSIAQDQLESQQSLLRGRAAAIRQTATEQGNLLESKFSDDLIQNTSNFLKDISVEQSIPGVLKLAQAGAQNVGGFTSRVASALESGENIAGNLAQKIAPSGKIEPSDDIEMQEISPSDVQPPPSAPSVKPITQDDIPQGAGGGQDVSNLGARTTQVDDPAALTRGDPDGSALKDMGFTEEDAEGLFPKEGGIGETNIDTGITDVAEAGEGAAEAAEETLPEIAGSLGASVGEAIGSAIPVVGWIGSLASMITGAVDLAKSPNDPFQAIRQKIQSANTQTQQIEAKVSSDQFQQRIGAAMPSFGSLAVAGQRAQQSVALHD